MKVQFEFATADDLPAIVAIYNQAIPAKRSTADLTPVMPHSKLDWFNNFNHDERPLWKMMSNEKIIGWVGLEYFYGRPAYCHTAEISLYLASRYQHQGLGQAALNFVFSQLTALQIDTLVAYIFSHNPASLRLFTQNGFATWGILPGVAEIDGQKRDLKILGRHFQAD